ncbi:MAG TPA: ABC transporter permease [Vicinamibacterales bacterium]|nr:ABC transporter permease [Vicinamibacterales bacterium]
MIGSRFYRQLLRLFPPAFRERFEIDMTGVFDDRRRAARRVGTRAIAAFYVRTLVDVGTHAIAERRGERRRTSFTQGVIAMWWEDVIAALRGLVRRPGPALSAASMLAIGLGFNIALFAVVDAVLLTPLPYRDPDRLVMLWTGRNADGTGGVNSYADVLDWRAGATTMEGIAAFNISFGTLAGDDPEEINGSVVTPEFFSVLGVPMLHGRGIEAGDERIRSEDGRPIVISHSLWARRFSSDPSIVGRTITLAERQRRVVGVVAPQFAHPEPFWYRNADYWSPLTVSDEMRSEHGYRYLRAIGRIRADSTIAAARAELDGIGRRLMATYPKTNTASVVVAPLHDELAGNSRPLALLFFCATGLVLFLGVANNVNLLLARANSRRTELAIRTALGAGRGRLATQMMIESLMLGLVAGLIGLALAHLGVRLFLSTTPVNLPGAESASLNPVVIAFGLGLSALTGLLCGVVPAARVARARLSSSIGDMRGSTGLEVSRARTVLVAVEMTLAVPLLVGALLLVRTLIDLQRVDPGFDPAQAMQFRLTLPDSRYSDGEARVEFHARLVERLDALPGVASVGAASSLPLGGLNNTGGSIVYERVDGSLGETGIGMRSATSGYFRALGVPLRQGRIFGDTAADAQTVVINERAASTLWPAMDPIGRRLRFGSPNDPADQIRWLTVIGVVGDLRHEALNRPGNAELFRPYQSNPWSTMSVVVRTEANQQALAQAIRAAVREADPSLPVVGFGAVREFLDGQLARPRFGVFCALVFSVLGLALAAFGTFAVLSLLVTQRTREIGIRMALGATPQAVRRMVLAQSMLPALIGCLAGALFSRWIGRALEAELFVVRPGDAVSLAAGLGTLVIVALAASWMPTRRAVRTDPIVTLRNDG